MSTKTIAIAFVVTAALLVVGCESAPDPAEDTVGARQLPSEIDPTPPERPEIALRRIDPIQTALIVRPGEPVPIDPEKPLVPPRLVAAPVAALSLAVPELVVVGENDRITTTRDPAPVRPADETRIDTNTGDARLPPVAAEEVGDEDAHTDRVRPSDTADEPVAATSIDRSTGSVGIAAANEELPTPINVERPITVPVRPQATTIPGSDPVRQSTTRREEDHSRQTIAVDPGTQFEVRLPGLMWVFVGSEGEVLFVRRESDQNESVFTFRLPRSSTAPILRFESQDLTTGRVLRRIVGIVPPGRDDEPAAADVATVGESPAPDQAGQDAPLSQRLLSALSNQRVDPEIGEELVTALSEDNMVDELWPEVEEIAELLARQDDTNEAIGVYEALLDTGYTPYDRFLFRLAQLLEQQGQSRDLRRARSLYQELVDDYPLSNYWNRSNTRIEYLDRHFFLIR